MATSGSKAYSSSYFNGSTAEWIVERTIINGSYPDLADFRSDSFTGDEARTTSGTWQYLSGSDNALEMTSNGYSSGTELAHPGSVGSYGSFTDYWHNW